MKAVFVSDYSVREREVPDARPFYDLPIGSDLTRYGKDYDVAGECARYTLADELMFDGRPIYAAEGWLVRKAGAGFKVAARLGGVAYIASRAEASRINVAWIEHFVGEESLNTTVYTLDERTYERDAFGATLEIEYVLERIVAYSQVNVVKQRLAGRAKGAMGYWTD